MKPINFNGLPKNITVGELIEMSKVYEKMETNQGKRLYKKLIKIRMERDEPYAERLVEDLEEKSK